MITKIKIYTTNSCPYCVKAKRYFTDKGFQFEEINLTGQFDKIDALKLKTGHLTVPQIFINESFIGGYSDLIDKINSGELVLTRS